MGDGIREGTRDKGHSGCGKVGAVSRGSGEDQERGRERERFPSLRRATNKSAPVSGFYNWPEVVQLRGNAVAWRAGLCLP